MGNDLVEKANRLSRLDSAENIRVWYDEFTGIMAARKHHSIMDGDDLDTLAKQIVSVVDLEFDPTDSLLGVAALGRLAAVARGRENKVYRYVDSVLDDDPPKFEVLADGDEREYAAIALRHTSREWLLDYCLTQAIEIDRADKARKELLRTALQKCGDISSFFIALTKVTGLLASVEGDRARLLRVRRILTVMREVLNDWDESVGNEVGERLAGLLTAMAKPRSDELEDADWFAIADAAVGSMLRIVELRFSHALVAETYSVLGAGKTALGRDRWLGWLSKSQVADKVRVCLSEAALVLARQGKQDPDFVEPMLQAYGDRRAIARAMADNFRGAPDLEPEVRLWWEKAGDVRANVGKLEQRVGSSVDDQVGALLLEIESAREGVNKLQSAVEPLLKISDPPLASKVARTSGQFTEISQIVRRLARARKLSLSETKGQEMEYNPREHVLVDGKSSGVRRVCVIRDGVRKDFGGRVKTIVKAWVTPAD